MTLNPTKNRDSNAQPQLSGDSTYTHTHAATGAEIQRSSNIPIVSDKVVNVGSVPQRSPLRYPGGKTWLVPEIRKWLFDIDFRPELFIEPFAGGGIAALTAVMEDYVDHAILCEKDPDLSNLWRCMLDDAERLAQRVESFVPTQESVGSVFDNEAPYGFDAAFRTLLRNRINRGGIIAKGASRMNKGENGKGIASRWYGKTLAGRIRAIGGYSNRLEIVQGDGIELIDLLKNNGPSVFFIDPPYTAAGKRAGRRLYTYNEIDHRSLFERMSVVKSPFMMTYDENTEVIEMARTHGFHLAKVAMKNTHHALMYELLITSHELFR